MANPMDPHGTGPAAETGAPGEATLYLPLELGPDEWNVRHAGRPLDRCVHELFAEQAGRTPGAVAVLTAAEALSYAELDARAGRLARRLRAAGVGPEVPVAACAGNTPELLVAVLAT